MDENGQNVGNFAFHVVRYVWSYLWFLKTQCQHAVCFLQISLVYSYNYSRLTKKSFQKCPNVLQGHSLCVFPPQSGFILRLEPILAEQLLKILIFCYFFSNDVSFPPKASSLIIEDMNRIALRSFTRFGI